MKPNPVHDFRPPIAYGARRSSSHPPALKGPGHAPAGPSLWSEYWQEFCLENIPHERCHVPGDGRDAVDRHWVQFAEHLPHGAQVIDLGCGAGIAGRILLGHRNDLRVTGIDFANVPTIPLENLTIHPWVSMEDLPFNNGCFDAAISLFGIEYGNIGETAKEVGRVLKPGARFSFLVHHHESEIVSEGDTRRLGLRELLSGKVKAAFLAGSVAGLDQQIQGLKKRFPGEASVKHFTTYIRHHITRTRAERQALWQNMLDNLHPEIALLTQLERSAKSAMEMGSWLGSLFPIMTAVSVTVLRRSSGHPIAWQVDGKR